MRSHRLTVRTSGSHPGNPGSIPGEITIENDPSCDGSFSMDRFVIKTIAFESTLLEDIDTIYARLQEGCHDDRYDPPNA